MRVFRPLLKKFARNEDGYFAALFGLMVVSLTATAGAVVDYVNVQNTRAIVQQALDTTTLALQPLILSKTEAQLKSQAQTLINQIAAVNGLPITIETATKNEGNGILFLQAKVDIPLYFVSLVGVNNITARIASQVTKKASHQEIVLVLDNSGSMAFSSRMTNLKTAAINATNTLMATVSSTNDVKMGVVPFTSYVNVGKHNNAAAWMDVAGQNDIGNDNFDSDDNDATAYTGPVNRLSLYNQIGIDWMGCVEARAHYSTGAGKHLDTDDTAPTPSNKNTQFTPLFMPDERDYNPFDATTWGYSNNYMSDTTNSCANPSGLSVRERQERLCKYSPQNTVTTTAGPNDDCPSTEILPLTDTKQNVIDEINAMSAGGGTNIHMGTIWGFRVLSPTQPFTEGGAYDDDLSKVMIIMTDGENTTAASSNINGADWYSAYGYPWNGRLGAVGWTTAQLEAEMDNRTLESCANAKAEGITVYTIGLSPPNNAVKTMLQTCATSTGHAYFPTAPSELDSVFQAIANEIVAARITQ
ncbi:MAG: pilus assembly protein [Hyphomicrobiaceae bacterium]|nr:pilus assembly protein [Hyphomicrobiaceae bacterium]